VSSSLESLSNPGHPEHETHLQSLPDIAQRRRGITRAMDRLLITASGRNEFTKELDSMIEAVCAVA
jgi:hypothetical protein